MAPALKRAKTGPLPPAPQPAEFVYGRDAVTGAYTPDPAGVHGAVSVPIARIPDYLAAHGLKWTGKWFEMGSNIYIVVAPTVVVEKLCG